MDARTMQRILPLHRMQNNLVANSSYHATIVCQVMAFTISQTKPASSPQIKNWHDFHRMAGGFLQGRECMGDFSARTHIVGRSSFIQLSLFIQSLAICDYLGIHREGRGGNHCKLLSICHRFQCKLSSCVLCNVSCMTV